MVGLVPIGEGPVEVPASDRKIDYDRGVVIKLIKELGMEVFMYKDTPGVFLSQHGTEVSPLLAKRAGYDVDLLMRKREHARLVALATASATEKLNLSSENATKQVIAEQGGFQVVLIGGSRYVLLSPDGAELTKGIPLTEQVALELLKEVAPQATPAAVLDGRDNGGGVGADGGSPVPSNKAVNRKIAP